MTAGDIESIMDHIFLLVFFGALLYFLWNDQ